MPDMRLIEPVPIDDDLCSGLALIEEADVGARFVLFARQPCYETGETLHVVKRKIVLPVTAIWPGVQTTLRFLAGRNFRGGCRLVK